MKNKRTFYLGLAYPNALIIGLLFLSIGLFGISNLLYRFEFNAITYIQLPIFLFVLGIGMLSLSIKLLKFDLFQKQLSIGTLYFCFIFKCETIPFEKITKAKVVRSRGNYSAGGNFLYTAKSSFSSNETAIFLYSDSGEKLAKLEKLSDAKIAFLTEFFSKTLNIDIMNKN